MTTVTSAVEKHIKERQRKEYWIKMIRKYISKHYYHLTLSPIMENDMRIQNAPLLSPKVNGTQEFDDFIL